MSCFSFVLICHTSPFTTERWIWMHIFFPVSLVGFLWRSTMFSCFLNWRLEGVGEGGGRGERCADSLTERFDFPKTGKWDIEGHVVFRFPLATACVSKCFLRPRGIEINFVPSNKLKPQLLSYTGAQWEPVDEPITLLCCVAAVWPCRAPVH